MAFIRFVKREKTIYVQLRDGGDTVYFPVTGTEEERITLGVAVPMPGNELLEIFGIKSVELRGISKNSSNEDVANAINDSKEQQLSEQMQAAEESIRSINDTDEEEELLPHAPRPPVPQVKYQLRNDGVVLKANAPGFFTGLVSSPTYTEVGTWQLSADGNVNFTFAAPGQPVNAIRATTRENLRTIDLAAEFRDGTNSVALARLGNRAAVDRWLTDLPRQYPPTCNPDFTNVQQQVNIQTIINAYGIRPPQIVGYRFNADDVNGLNIPGRNKPCSYVKIADRQRDPVLYYVVYQELNNHGKVVNCNIVTTREELEAVEALRRENHLITYSYGRYQITDNGLVNFSATGAPGSFKAIGTWTIADGKIKILRNIPVQAPRPAAINTASFEIQALEDLTEIPILYVPEFQQPNLRDFLTSIPTKYPNATDPHMLSVINRVGADTFATVSFGKDGNNHYVKIKNGVNPEEIYQIEFDANGLRYDVKKSLPDAVIVPPAGIAWHQARMSVDAPVLGTINTGNLIQIIHGNPSFSTAATTANFNRIAYGQNPRGKFRLANDGTVLFAVNPRNDNDYKVIGTWQITHPGKKIQVTRPAGIAAIAKTRDYVADGDRKFSSSFDGELNGNNFDVSRDVETWIKGIPASFFGRPVDANIDSIVQAYPGADQLISFAKDPTPNSNKYYVRTKSGAADAVYYCITVNPHSKTASTEIIPNDRVAAVIPAAVVWANGYATQAVLQEITPANLVAKIQQYFNSFAVSVGFDPVARGERVEPTEEGYYTYCNNGLLYFRTNPTDPLPHEPVGRWKLLPKEDDNFKIEFDFSNKTPIVNVAAENLRYYEGENKHHAYTKRVKFLQASNLYDGLRMLQHSARAYDIQEEEFIDDIAIANLAELDREFGAIPQNRITKFQVIGNLPATPNIVYYKLYDTETKRTTYMKVENNIRTTFLTREAIIAVGDIQWTPDENIGMGISEERYRSLFGALTHLIPTKITFQVEMSDPKVIYIKNNSRVPPQFNLKFTLQDDGSYKKEPYVRNNVVDLTGNWRDVTTTADVVHQAVRENDPRACIRLFSAIDKELLPFAYGIDLNVNETLVQRAVPGGAAAASGDGTFYLKNADGYEPEFLIKFQRDPGSNIYKGYTIPDAAEVPELKRTLNWEAPRPFNRAHLELALEDDQNDDNAYIKIVSAQNRQPPPTPDHKIGFATQGGKHYVIIEEWDAYQNEPTEQNIFEIQIGADKKLNVMPAVDDISAARITYCNVPQGRREWLSRLTVLNLITEVVNNDEYARFAGPEFEANILRYRPVSKNTPVNTLRLPPNNVAWKRSNNSATEPNCKIVHIHHPLQGDIYVKETYADHTHAGNPRLIERIMDPIIFQPVGVGDWEPIGEADYNRYKDAPRLNQLAGNTTVDRLPNLLRNFVWCRKWQDPVNNNIRYEHAYIPGQPNSHLCFRYTTLADGKVDKAVLRPDALNFPVGGERNQDNNWIVKDKNYYDNIKSIFPSNSQHPPFEWLTDPNGAYYREAPNGGNIKYREIYRQGAAPIICKIETRMEPSGVTTVMEVQPGMTTLPPGYRWDENWQQADQATYQLMTRNVAVVDFLSGDITFDRLGRLRPDKHAWIQTLVSRTDPDVRYQRITTMPVGPDSKVFLKLTYAGGVLQRKEEVTEAAVTGDVQTPVVVHDANRWQAIDRNQYFTELSGFPANSVNPPHQKFLGADQVYRRVARRTGVIADLVNEIHEVHARDGTKSYTQITRLRGVLSQVSPITPVPGTPYRLPAGYEWTGSWDRINPNDVRTLNDRYVSNTIDRYPANTLPDFLTTVTAGNFAWQRTWTEDGHDEIRYRQIYQPSARVGVAGTLLNIKETSDADGRIVRKELIADAVAVRNFPRAWQPKNDWWVINKPAFNTHVANFSANTDRPPFALFTIPGAAAYYRRAHNPADATIPKTYLYEMHFRLADGSDQVTFAQVQLDPVTDRPRSVTPVVGLNAANPFAAAPFDTFAWTGEWSEVNQADYELYTRPRVAPVGPVANTATNALPHLTGTQRAWSKEWVDLRPGHNHISYQEICREPGTANPTVYIKSTRTGGAVQREIVPRDQVQFPAAWPAAVTWLPMEKNALDTIIRALSVTSLPPVNLLTDPHVAYTRVARPIAPPLLPVADGSETHYFEYRHRDGTVRYVSATHRPDAGYSPMQALPADFTLPGTHQWQGTWGIIDQNEFGRIPVVAEAPARNVPVAPPAAVNAATVGFVNRGRKAAEPNTEYAFVRTRALPAAEWLVIETPHQRKIIQNPTAEDLAGITWRQPAVEIADNAALQNLLKKSYSGHFAIVEGRYLAFAPAVARGRPRQEDYQIIGKIRKATNAEPVRFDLSDLALPREEKAILENLNLSHLRFERISSGATGIINNVSGDGDIYNVPVNIANELNSKIDANTNEELKVRYRLFPNGRVAVQIVHGFFTADSDWQYVNMRWEPSADDNTVSFSQTDEWTRDQLRQAVPETGFLAETKLDNHLRYNQQLTFNSQSTMRKLRRDHENNTVRLGVADPNRNVDLDRHDYIRRLQARHPGMEVEDLDRGGIQKAVRSPRGAPYGVDGKRSEIVHDAATDSLIVKPGRKCSVEWMVENAVEKYAPPADRRDRTTVPANTEIVIYHRDEAVRNRLEAELTQRGLRVKKVDSYEAYKKLTTQTPPPPAQEHEPPVPHA